MELTVAINQPANPEYWDKLGNVRTVDWNECRVSGPDTVQRLYPNIGACAL